MVGAGRRWERQAAGLIRATGNANDRSSPSPGYVPNTGRCIPLRAVLGRHASRRNPMTRSQESFSCDASPSVAAFAATWFSRSAIDEIMRPTRSAPASPTGARNAARSLHRRRQPRPNRGRRQRGGAPGQARSQRDDDLLSGHAFPLRIEPGLYVLETLPDDVGSRGGDITAFRKSFR